MKTLLIMASLTAFSASAADTVISCYLNNLVFSQGHINIEIVNPESATPRVYFKSYSPVPVGKEFDMTEIRSSRVANRHRGLSGNYFLFSGISPEFSWNYFVPHTEMEVRFYPDQGVNKDRAGFVIVEGVTESYDMDDEDEERLVKVPVKEIGECDSSLK